MNSPPLCEYCNDTGIPVYKGYWADSPSECSVCPVSRQKRLMHKPFIHSAYWGTWSRRLSVNHPRGPYVDVNLTPISNCYSSSWVTDVIPIRIRAHGTAPRGRDFATEVLPGHIYDSMVSHCGQGLTNRLLSEDFLPQIDWDLYSKFCNGGANLEDIRLR